MEPVLKKINEELIEIVRRQNNSVLRNREFNGMANFDFNTIVEEMKASCAIVYKILSAMIDLEYNPERKLPPFRLCIQQYYLRDATR